MIDIHTHVLPCVDDGSPSMEESIRMIKDEIENGIDTIVATPHHHPYRSFMKTIPEIRTAYQSLCGELIKQNINVKLLLGQEIYVQSSEDIVKMIEIGELLTINGTKTVLIEFSPTREPDDVEEIIYSFMVKGYKVIVAHVERYNWMTYEKVKSIRSKFCKIQVNAGSIAGREVSFFRKGMVKKILKDGLVDYVASDVHSFRSTMISKAKAEVLKLTKSDRLFTKGIESI